MNDSNQSLERLNYYNGQRLEAADFRLEQAFHMQVRRELNKWLYTYGIASGLDVIKNPNDKHSVIVNPGLAIDKEGREIILLEPCTVSVRGRPSKPDEAVFGNYVVIEYAEEPVARVEDGCAVPPAKGKESCTLKWNGASRIRMKPALSMQNNWPGGNDEERKIVLAQLELDESCEVRAIRKGVRKYANAARALRTRLISIEGEKDIDNNNSKYIYFHIDGDYPERVLLYLYGDRFSTLYYTEMGSHTHDGTITVEQETHDFSHQHRISEGESDSSGGHEHGIRVNETEIAGVDTDESVGEGTGIIISAGEHTHTLQELSTDAAGEVWTHGHETSVATSDTGTSDRAVRPGDSLTYIDDLQISIDGVNVTAEILAKLNDRDGAGTWDKLGNGRRGHRFVIDRTTPSQITGGTGAIDLTTLNVDLSKGQHEIRLSVGSGGGQVHYNLYVE